MRMETEHVLAGDLRLEGKKLTPLLRSPLLLRVILRKPVVRLGGGL